MNKKHLLIGSVLIMAVVLMGTTAVSAADKDRAQRFGENLDPEKRAEIQEQRQGQREVRRAEREGNRVEMQTIVESGDYNTWKALHEEREANRFNILDVVNEDNFDRLIEMHNLKQDGDHEGAKVIAEELGFPENRGKMMQGKKGFRGMEK